MSNQLEWDAYRYVLQDPSLDRAAFEDRMLADIDLALAVAEAVSHVDALRAASFIATSADVPACASSSPSVRCSVASSGSVAINGSDATSAGWHWSKLAALAAGLLVAIGFINYQATRPAVDPVSGGANGGLAVQQSLAESWLAIRQVELVDVSSNLVDISSNLDVVRGEDSEMGEAAAIEVTAESDWLMNAAQEFFAQRGAS